MQADPTRPTINVLLAEDHLLLRTALARLINSFDNVTVVGEVTCPHELVEAASQTRTEVALIDGAMLSRGSLDDLLAQLRSIQPAVNTLITSTYASDGYIRRVVEAGACGFIHKNATVNELETAICKAADGHQVIFPGLETREPLASAESPSGDAVHPSLTRRQREVLSLIAHGFRSRAIAEQLNLSVKTVETHRAQIMRRLGRENTAGLVQDAIRLGLVPVPR